MNEVTKTCDLEEKKTIKEQDKWYHHNKLKVSVKQWTREQMKGRIRRNRKASKKKSRRRWGIQDFKRGTDYADEMSMIFNSDL